MGNDNKINKDLEKVTREFLPENIEADQTPRVEYSIDQEFARTKKNRNYWFLFFILGFVTAAVLATIFGSALLREQNKQVEVEITDFQDLRLKDLLEGAKQNEGRLEELRLEVSELSMEKDTAILDIQDAYRQRRESVIAARYSDAEAAQRLNALDSQERNAIAAKRSEYDGQIAEKQKEIAAIESKLDKEQIEKGSASSNTERLYKMRIDRINASHDAQLKALRESHRRQIQLLTLRYNPKFQSSQLNSIIRNNERAETPVLSPYRPVLQREVAYSSDRFGKLRKNIEDRDILVTTMNRISYVNSVPPTLQRIESLNNTIIADYDYLVDRMGHRLENYSYALDSMLRTRPESGYVLDPRNSKRIGVYMNKAVTVPTGTLAYVFRYDDEYVGSITLVRNKDGYNARVEQLAGGKTIQPFDKILLQIKGN